MAYIPPGTYQITIVTTTYTALLSDYLIKGDTTGGAFTISLPTAVGNSGKEYIIKNMGTSNLTIDPNSSQLIDGVATKTITNKYTSVNFVSDGTGWLTI